MTRVAFVIPTRDRPAVLEQTLTALSSYLDTEAGSALDAEVVIVEDAAGVPVCPGDALPCGAPITLIRLEERHGAAARNAGVGSTRAPWIVMLDDDSAPISGDLGGALARASADTDVVGFEITLPAEGRHEDGGLPEVHVGCGAALRRASFLAVGGYDRAFDYYAEEYDLCAKLIGRGGRIVHDFSVRIDHHKVGAGRDMNRILRRLVRNNGWVMQRYAPDAVRHAALARIVERYARIAEREDARSGYAAGRLELDETLAAQPRMPLAPDAWDRFTGAAAVHGALGDLVDSDVRLVAAGKHADVVREVLEGQGCRIESAGVPVIATLSPGPLVHAARDLPAARCPWWPRHATRDGAPIAMAATL